MFKFIFLTQVFVYLILAPYIVMDNKSFYYPPIVLGFLSALSILFGIYLRTFDRTTVLLSSANVEKIVPRYYLSWVIFVFSLMYIYVSYTNGLMNRRLGSEYMAALYAGLPIYNLIILRLFEIIFTPLLTLYLLSAKNISTSSQIRAFISLLMAIPFMGFLDSRGKLILIFINIICFIEFSQLFRIIMKQVWAVILLSVAIFAFLFFSLQRLEGYADYREYLYSEFYTRIDGLNLITQLKDQGLTSFWGEFDFNLFDPLISRIPFLEAAVTAKMEGRTSTKQYYLQDLLQTKRFDDSSSMINDPYYFGGIIGLFIAFVALGYYISKFDNFINDKKMLTNKYSTALAFAFVSAFVMIEADFVGAFTTLAQNFFIVLGLLLIGCERQSLNRVNQINSRPVRLLTRGMIG
jgi:hypothetical protein